AGSAILFVRAAADLPDLVGPGHAAFGHAARIAVRDLGQPAAVRDRYRAPRVPGGSRAGQPGRGLVAAGDYRRRNAFGRFLDVPPPAGMTAVCQSNATIPRRIAVCHVPSAYHAYPTTTNRAPRSNRAYNKATSAPAIGL